MATKGDEIAYLSKFMLLKRIEGANQMGFIVYRGIPELDRITMALSDSMNELQVCHLDDNDSFIFFSKIAGVPSEVFIGPGLRRVPDTIVFELARMSRLARKVIEELQ